MSWNWKLKQRLDRYRLLAVLNRRRFLCSTPCFLDTMPISLKVNLTTTQVSLIHKNGLICMSHSVLPGKSSKISQLLNSLDASAFDDIHVKLTQKGLEKSMIHIPHRKAPLMPSILFQFHAHRNLYDSAYLVLWSTHLVGFFTFFCTTNLVTQAFDSFSPQHTLSRGSVYFNDSGACLTITKTKTRQAGDTALVIPVSLILGLPLCPTTALKSLLRMVLPLTLLLSSRSLPPRISSPVSWRSPSTMLSRI